MLILLKVNIYSKRKRNRVIISNFTFQLLIFAKKPIHIIFPIYFFKF